MEWVVEKDFTAYAERVLPWLERGPVRNSVPATMCLLRREGSVPVDTEAWLAWLAGPGDAVTGAATGFTPGQPLQPDPVASTRRLIEQGRHWLWRVDGTPVCMAGHNPAVAGATRIGPVWTPREHRRHGYARAATAALAARLRPGRVLLYADDANPSAVGICTRIGFRPVGEWTDWRLEY